MISQKETRVDVSIIVPVYNVEEFLRPCLDSIRAQVFSGVFEVILVEDCSTDSSKTICDEYVALYPSQFRLLCHSENKGLSVVRNTGLADVRGSYFTYVDSDDLLPINAIADLYTAAVKHDADLVKGNNTIFNDRQCRPASYNLNKELVLKRSEILSALYDHRVTRGHTWGKLYRSEKLKHVQNEPGVSMAQDVLYMAEVLSLVEKMVLIPSSVYSYRSRNQSVKGKKFQTKAFLWWFYSIEKSGQFAKVPIHKLKHQQLKIRTLLQVTKEVRKLEGELLSFSLHEIEKCFDAWDLANFWILLKKGISFRFLLYYLQSRWILAQLRKSVC